MDLSTIEKEIQTVIEADKASWIRIYQLMSEVESEKLYENTYSSYTQWVNKIAENMHIHVSLLWRRKKAGAFYSEYLKRMEARGKKVSFDDIERVSPDNLVLAERIAGNNTAIADQLIEKIQQGELKRKDLSSALAAAKRCRAEKGIPDPVNGYDKQKLQEQKETDEAIKPDQKKITAMDIMAALEIYRHWIGEPIEKQGRGKYGRRYRRMQTSTAIGQIMQAGYISNMPDQLKKFRGKSGILAGKTKRGLCTIRLPC